MMGIMIKAIVFDCFGVLASDGWLPFRERNFANAPEKLERTIELNKNVDAGQASYDDFIKEVSSLANVDEDDARKEIENNVPNLELFDLISTELKDNYKIGMLSNAGDNWLNEIFLPEQVELFDAVALSYETGIIKPNIDAYKIMASRLGVETNECVFIDDQPKYCEGAVLAGMRAIIYSNSGQLKYDLAQVLTNKF